MSWDPAAKFPIAIPLGDSMVKEAMGLTQGYEDFSTEGSCLVPTTKLFVTLKRLFVGEMYTPPPKLPKTTLFSKVRLKECSAYSPSQYGLTNAQLEMELGGWL